MNTPISDTFTPSTHREVTERYRAMIDINPKPAPVVKPPSWTPLYLGLALVGVALVAALVAVILFGVRS